MTDPTGRALKLERRDDGVAVIRIDVPGETLELSYRREGQTTRAGLRDSRALNRIRRPA